MADFCPRSITFTIPVKHGIGVQVTVVEDAGNLDFTVDVLGTPNHAADLRGLFFHFDEADLNTLSITGGDGLITATQIKANGVIDLGRGVNMHGAADPFDIGIAFGTPGAGQDFITGPVHFTLSNTAHDLTLDDIAHLQFGARLTSVGDKATFVAPAAPDAHDDQATTHEDTQLQIFPLANDTDADGTTLLKITEVHQDPNHHGTVEIAPDGKSLFYTPDKDYAGPNTDPNSVDDSFVYCVSDGKGGEDHATVNVHIIPVADSPNISIQVLAPLDGDPVNEVRLHITATTADVDGSESLTGFSLGALPADVTPNLGAVVHSKVGLLDSASQDVQLFLPTDHTTNFEFAVTATSAEDPGIGDPDTASNTVSKHIELDVNHNQTQENFQEQGQSIWSTGDAFKIDEHPFVGPNIPFDESAPFFDPPNPIPLEASIKGHFKAGLQVDLHIEGGSIDAHIPFDITADTLYNKTTDTLLIHTGAELAPGGGFKTTGPEGSVDLKFILDFLATVGIEDALGLGIGISKTLSLQPDPIHLPPFPISSTSPDLPYTVPLPAGLSIGFDWPHLSVADNAQNGNLISGDGASNNFIQLNADLDFAAAQLFPLFAPIEAILDPDPTSDSNFEIFDLDVKGGANFLQKFVLEALGLTGMVTLEDGEHNPFGQDFVIHNASKVDGLDANNTIDFSVLVTPNVMLHNTTSIGFNIGGQLGLIKNIPIIDDSLFDRGITIPIASIPLADDQTFPLVFNSQSADFFV